MFRRALSETGAFELTWPAVPAASLHAWLLLVDPERLDPSQLRPEVLLRELIRTPLVPGAGRARLYVPAGRVVGLALVARDAADEPLASPPFELVDAPVDAPVDVAPAPMAAAVAPVPARAAPVAMPGARVERAPFVFAASAQPRGAGPGVSFEALADRVAASASVPAARTPGPTGFGTRQRFYLTRLAFPSGYAGPRVVVIRRTFIGEHDLEAWAAAPPPDAHDLPAVCDGFVDALTPDDEMAFYAVLQGPAPWRPLPLTTIQPPFESCRNPCFIGDGRARLGPWLRGAPPSGPQRELLEAALRGAPW